MTNPDHTSGQHFRRLSLPAEACVAAVALGLLAAATGSASAWELRVCADQSRTPFSNGERTGFENRIAEIIADELDATLVLEWWPQRDVQVANALRPGLCDVIIGADAGAGDVLTTIAYYRAPFVFVYRANEGYDIRTFDDPILADLVIGVQPTFGPTHLALSKRGHGEHIVEFQFVGGAEHPFAPVIEAVANGDIDVAAVWGPAAGYYAARQPVELVVQPVPPFEPPLIPMYINIGIGVRLGDEALRDRIDLALAARWDDIYDLLEEYNIPTMPLPRPTQTIEAP
jgi:mxaJ protein